MVQTRRVYHRDCAAAHDFQHPLWIHEGGGVLIDPDAGCERIVRQGRQQPADAVPLAKMLIDDHLVGQPQAGGHGDSPLARGGTVAPAGDHVFGQNRGPGGGAGDHHTVCVEAPYQAGHRGAAKDGREPQLIATGDKHPGRAFQYPLNFGIQAILALIYRNETRVRTHGLKHFHVTRPRAF